MLAVDLIGPSFGKISSLTHIPEETILPEAWRGVSFEPRMVGKVDRVA
jgi:hypothetical protein